VPSNLNLIIPFTANLTNTDWFIVGYLRDRQAIDVKQAILNTENNLETGSSRCYPSPVVRASRAGKAAHAGVSFPLPRPGLHYPGWRRVEMAADLTLS
jgi:hypothetical protein